MKFSLNLLLIFLCTTSQAQRLIKELTPGRDDNYAIFMGNTQNGFIMNVLTPRYGNEPWVSDGTSQGTQLLKDIIHGNSSSLLIDFSYSNDTLLYFLALNQDQSGSTLKDLWRTDGTPEGTFLIDSFGESYPVMNYDECVFYKGEFYYSVLNSTSKTIYATDGSKNAPRIVATFKSNNYESRSNLAVFNHKLYFYAYTDKYGTELWSSDGTVAGTKMVADFYAGTNSSKYNSGKLLAHKDKLFFVAQRNTTEGYELFYISSTDSGPWLFNDFTPTSGLSSYVELANGNDSCFFINVLGTGDGTYISDGHWVNTRKFENTAEPNTSFQASRAYQINNNVLVCASSANTGTELYKSDALLNNKGVLIDINPGGGSGISWKGDIFTVNNKGYFLGSNSMLGTDIWVTDGTEDSTKLYLEFLGNFTTNDKILHQWKNRIFFFGTIDPKIGGELYELDLSRSTGIPSVQADKITIYPNPGHPGSVITIDAEDETVITWYNASGQIVHQSTCRNHKTEVPAVAVGLYFIELKTNTRVKHSMFLLD